MKKNKKKLLAGLKGLKSLLKCESEQYAQI